MKKIIIICLCVLLVVFPLVGCGSQGPVGPQGPPGPKGDQGPPGQDGGITIPRIHQLGETYTHYSMGIEMFSIRVVSANRLYITDISMNGFRPGLFIRVRGDGNVNNVHSFGTHRDFAIGEEVVHSVFLTGSMLWFGYPIDNNGLIPYVIFNIQTSS